MNGTVMCYQMMCQAVEFKINKSQESLVQVLSIRNTDGTTLAWTPDPASPAVEA